MQNQQNYSQYPTPGQQGQQPQGYYQNQPTTPQQTNPIPGQQAQPSQGYYQNPYTGPKQTNPVPGQQGQQPQGYYQGQPTASHQPNTPQAGYGSQPGYPNQQNTNYTNPSQATPGYGQQNPASYNPTGQAFNPNAGYQNPSMYPQQGVPSQVGQGSYAPQGNQGQQQYFAPAIIPSLKAQLNSNPTNDANTIFSAFKGFGADWKVVMTVLTHRTSFQRQTIKQEFKKMFQKCLIDTTKSEFTDPLVRIAVALEHTGPDMDAYFLRKAIKKPGSDESTFINVLCTRSGGQIGAIINSYQQLFRKSLLDDAQLDTSGEFESLLSHLLTIPREDSQPANPTLADMHVRELDTRNSTKMSAPNSLIRMLCTSSFAQIKLTMQHFHMANRKTLNDWIKEHTENSYSKALISICLFVENPIRYFSIQLRNCIEKGDIDIAILIVCTRCELDLGSILQDYQVQYKSSADRDIQRAFGADAQTSVDSLHMLMGCI